MMAMTKPPISLVRRVTGRRILNALGSGEGSAEISGEVPAGVPAGVPAEVSGDAGAGEGADERLRILTA